MNAPTLKGWGVRDAALLIARIDLDLQRRAREDEELIRKGRLNKTEADYRRGVIADIRADLLHYFTPVNGLAPAMREPAVAWRLKVRWINLELEAAERDGPELERKGRLERGESQKRIRFLAELRRIYWNNLFAWFPEKGEAADYCRALRDLDFADRAACELLRHSAGARAYREELRAIAAIVEGEEAQGRLVA